jgi:hypothetical protein
MTTSQSLIDRRVHTAVAFLAGPGRWANSQVVAVNAGIA